MPIISAVVGLFCYDKFEETINEKVVNMSKLTKSYFSANPNSTLWPDLVTVAIRQLTDIAISRR